MYLVCTRSMYQDKHGMYLVCIRYVLVHTRKKKKSMAWRLESNPVSHAHHPVYYTTTPSVCIPWWYGWLIQGIYTLNMTPAAHGTFWLVPDVLRGSRRAPGTFHDITGQDINLNFPDAQLRCRTGLRSSNVAVDRRPNENRPLHLAHTKRVMYMYIPSTCWYEHSTYSYVLSTYHYIRTS